MSATQKIMGHFYAIFTILVWGSCFVLTKEMLTTYTAIQIIPLRMALAYVTLWVLRPKTLKLPRKDELMFILIGVTGGSLYFFLQNTALSYTYAANVSILVALAPILTVILAQLFSRSGERLGKYVYIGAVIAIVGVVLVVLNGQLTFHLNPLGDLIALGAPGVQPDAHQRQTVPLALHRVVEGRLADALTHTLDHVALVVAAVPEQQVGEGGVVLLRRAPEDGKVLLGDPVLRHGGGELAGDLPAAGEQHNAAHQPVQPVDGGDIVVLPRCPVVLPQKGGHTGTGVAVLGQHAHGLDAQHKVGVLVENTDRLHGRISGGGHGRRGGGSGCCRPCRSGGCARRGGTTARGLRP